MIYDRGGFGKSCGEEAILKIFNHTLIGREAFRVGEIPHHTVLVKSTLSIWNSTLGAYWMTLEKAIFFKKRLI